MVEPGVGKRLGPAWPGRKLARKAAGRVSRLPACRQGKASPSLPSPTKPVALHRAPAPARYDDGPSLPRRLDGVARRTGDALSSAAGALGEGVAAEATQRAQHEAEVEAQRQALKDLIDKSKAAGGRKVRVRRTAAPTRVGRVVACGRRSNGDWRLWLGGTCVAGRPLGGALRACQAADAPALAGLRPQPCSRKRLACLKSATTSLARTSRRRSGGCPSGGDDGSPVRSRRGPEPLEFFCSGQSCCTAGHIPGAPSPQFFFTRNPTQRAAGAGIESGRRGCVCAWLAGRPAIRRRPWPSGALSARRRQPSRRCRTSAPCTCTPQGARTRCP